MKYIQWNVIFVVCCLSLVFSCAGSLEIATEPPGAEVLVGGKKIGKTPMAIDDPGTPDSSGGHFVKLKLAGYQDLIIWYPSGSWNYSIHVNLNPLSLSNIGNTWTKSAISPQVVDSVSMSLLEIQTKLAAGSKIDVKILDEIILANPHLASGYLLRGIYYLGENKQSDAIIDLNKAALLDKGNQEVHYLVEKYGIEAKKK